MPYPESCPECGSTFRNTGTHFTARRNEVGRHVLLELGCQNTTRRFWWDFTTGNLTEDGRPSASVRRADSAEALAAASVPSAMLHAERNGSSHAASSGHATLSTLELSERDAEPDVQVKSDALEPDVHAHSTHESPARPVPATDAEPRSRLTALPLDPDVAADKRYGSHAAPEPQIEPECPVAGEPRAQAEPEGSKPVEPRTDAEPERAGTAESLAQHKSELPIAAVSLAHDDAELERNADAPTNGVGLSVAPTAATDALKEAFLRQLQLDRLTLRQMRSWLMSEEARRAIEVAAGATEATYERLALILFETELPQLLGRSTPVAQSAGMSAEDRLELQREKARIRARLRRAAAKAARQTA